MQNAIIMGKYFTLPSKITNQEITSNIQIERSTAVGHCSKEGSLALVS